MSTISAAAITDAGYAALVNALATGSKVFPQTARVSASVHEIDRELTALTDYWWEGDITLVSVIDENTYEARVVILPDQADDYMRTVALYLDDGTLFAVSAAKDLPPGVGQEIIIQLTYRDIVALTDFQYLGWEGWENQLEIMDKFSQLGNSILENAEAIGLLEDRISGFSDDSQAIDDLENSVSDNTQAIGALSGQVSQNTSDIGDLDGRVSQNTSDISDLSGQVAQNTSDISSLNSQVAGNDQDISDLDSRISQNTSDISALDGRVTGNDQDISSLNSQVSGNTSDISSLSGQVSQNTSDISALDGRVTANDQDITSLTSQVSQNTSDISALDGRVTSNDQDISSLTSQVSNNTSNISALDGRVTSNDQDISDLQNAIHHPVTIGKQSISLILPTVIDQDLTLTCSPTSTSADFWGDDALAQALAALEPYEITGQVTIQLADGVYGATTPLQSIVLTHKNIDRISIVGNIGDTIELALSGNADVANKQFTLFNTDGTFSVSDFVPTGGNYRDFIVVAWNSDMNDGVYTVAGATVSGNMIVVTVNESLIAPTGMSIDTDYMILMPANRCQLIFADGQNGFVRKDQPGTVRISGVSLWGSKTPDSPSGFLAQGSGVVMQLNHVQVHGFFNGLYADYNASIGFAETDLHFTRAFCYGCHYGFRAEHGGTLNVPFCCASFSNYAGFYGQWHGQVFAQYSLASRGGSGYSGFTAEDGAYIYGELSRSFNNTTGYLARGGRIYRNNAYVAGNTNSDYSPPDPPSQETTYGGWII